MGPGGFDWKSDRQRRRERWGALGVTIKRRHHKGSSLFVGGFITLLGVALLLDNLGILEFREIWRYWPAILVAMGVGRVLSTSRPSGWIWGGLLIVAGTLLLLRNLGVLSFHVDGRLIGPLLLIGFGTMMLVRALERSDINAGSAGLAGGPAGGPDVSSERLIREYAFFTGTKRRIRSTTFEGGDLCAMFGGIDIDMRDTVMSGPQANLDIQAMFGGVELRVPESWVVDLRGMALFGGYDDKTVPPRVEEGKVPPRLIVTGNAMFGGVSIRN